MNGLEKIIERISGDSKKEADAIHEKALNDIAEIKAESEKKISAECEKIKQRSDSEINVIKERAKSSADLSYRQIMLEGKQELINETILSAKSKLENLPDADYISFIGDLLKKHTPTRDAILYFNSRDLKRIPRSTMEGFVSEASKNGAKVSLSDKPADIKNGFILDYGGIEENCTFDALIEQNIEMLEDVANSTLFD